MSVNSVLVVGGSRGLGRALVREFANRHLSVCGVFRSGEPPAIPGVEWLAGDVTAAESLDSANSWLRNGVERRMVILCAAESGPVGPIESVRLDQWQRALEVNVYGLAVALQVLLPSLGPSDLFVAFLGGGVGGPRPLLDSTAYTTSKAAVAALIEVVARSHLEQGPSIIGVSPGSYPTALARTTGVIKEVVDDFDASELSDFLLKIASEDSSRWSGRCLSAKRDDFHDLLQIDQGDVDSLRMRRVDGFSIAPVGSW